MYKEMCMVQLLLVETTSELRPKGAPAAPLGQRQSARPYGCAVPSRARSAAVGWVHRSGCRSLFFRCHRDRCSGLFFCHLLVEGSRQWGDADEQATLSGHRAHSTAASVALRVIAMAERRDRQSTEETFFSGLPGGVNRGRMERDHREKKRGRDDPAE